MDEKDKKKESAMAKSNQMTVTKDNQLQLPISDATKNSSDRRSSSNSIKLSKLTTEFLNDPTSLVGTLIKRHHVMLFTKSYCPQSKMIRKCFDKISVPYFVLEVDSRTDHQSIMNYFAKTTNAGTLPRVYVGGTCIGGTREVINLFDQNALYKLVSQQMPSTTNKSK